MPFFYCLSLRFSPINKAKFWCKLLVFSSLLQYLELRFNKYLRLCGTFLFIIQTASKPQSGSWVRIATRAAQLDTAGCLPWAADGVITGEGPLGARKRNLCTKAIRWRANAGPPSLWHPQALLSTWGGRLASAPCSGTLTGTRKQCTEQSLACPQRSPQKVQNVNMPQLSAVADLILWATDSVSLANSQRFVESDRENELSGACHWQYKALYHCWESANKSYRSLTALGKVKLKQSLHYYGYPAHLMSQGGTAAFQGTVIVC